MGVASSAPASNDALSPLDFLLEIAEHIHEDVAALCKEKGLKAFASSLRAELFNINEILSDRENLVRDEGAQQSASVVLFNLEQLCQWPMVLTFDDYIRSAFVPEQYPCLHDLAATEGSIQERIRTVAKDATARNFRRQLLKVLADFGSTEQDVNRPGISEMMNNKGRLDESADDNHRHLKNLYTAVSTTCACKCEDITGSTITNLRLNWSRKEDFHEMSYISFGLLFRHKHEVIRPLELHAWQDTRVSIPSQRKSMVQFSDQRRSKTPEKQLVRIHPVSEFCKLIRKSTRAQLHFIASEQGFEYQTAAQTSRSFLTNSESVPLSALLPSQQLTAKMKALLSFFIARSVWQCYDSDWMKSWWTHDSVHFMSEYHRPHAEIVFINEPFLRIELEDTNVLNDAPEQTQSFTTHLYPKILGLGVMLLEIELGRPIQELSHPDIGNLDDVNGLHMAACDILRDHTIWPPDDIFSDVKEIIRICIEPDLEKLDLVPTLGLSRDSGEVRSRLYKSVVTVLEEFVRQAWDHPDNVKVNPIQPRVQLSVKTLKPKPSMAQCEGNTFNNHERIMSQIGQQHVHGDIHYHYSHKNE